MAKENTLSNIIKAIKYILRERVFNTEIIGFICSLFINRTTEMYVKFVL